MDMQKAVESAMTNLVASGKIEAMIEKKLEETIKSLIDDNLKSWSEFGKALGEAVKNSIKFDGSKLSLPEYNTLILNSVTEIIQREMTEPVRKACEEKLAKLFKPLNKTEYTITEIVEMFHKDIVGDAENDSDGDEDKMGQEFSLFIERSSGGWLYLSLDEEEGKSKYSCKFRIHVYLKEGKILSIDADGTKLDKAKNSTSLHGFADTLFKMYASGVKIVDDGAQERDLCRFPDRRDY